ncbi:MAG TPA: hypothetical protein DET40_16045 [Lentisphaeria bacterium]|nr:MAG: hypothetical protein A2X45_22410 [Lentisphaerae bacterium GWF2_50_93]HCE45052.1 hypothetical protein [Lentisphaeria bacterium]
MYKSVALKILKRVRSNFEQTHTYRQVEANRFRHLSLEFYCEKQKELEHLGFSYLADFEDELLKKQSPDPRTFIRVMTSGDGLVNAGIYQIRPNIIWRILMYFFGVRHTRIVEFQSELENGCQIVTSNIQENFMMPTSPMLCRSFMPASTPIEALFNSHKNNLEEARQKTGMQPLANRTLKDILEFENRQIKIQKEYLKSIGWVTKEYLPKQGANQKNAQAIYDEIQKILKEEENEL